MLESSPESDTIYMRIKWLKHNSTETQIATRSQTPKTCSKHINSLKTCDKITAVNTFNGMERF